MKKLFNLFILILAMNFLALAGGIGWLYRSGHLNRERVKAVKEIVFPPAPPQLPVTEPSKSADLNSPSKRLEALLARHAGGHSAAEQVAFLQQTFDSTMAQLDRRQREIEDLEHQVGDENRKLAEDRKALEAERQRLSDQERQAELSAADKGFQDTLSLYNSMPTKQVKQVFMTMDEGAVAQYLDAMQPRTAARIIKEFKAADDVERIKRVLEKMRHPPTVAPAAAPATQDSKE